jgi:hypothetical protein
MNERIRQLLNEATVGLEPDLSPQRTVTLNELEKFAELIVQECIHALWTEECRTNAMTHADYERSGQRIHKHFWG